MGPPNPTLPSYQQPPSLAPSHAVPPSSHDKHLLWQLVAQGVVHTELHHQAEEAVSGVVHLQEAGGAEPEEVGREGLCVCVGGGCQV